MFDVDLPTVAIGSIPGVLALIGAAVGHGRTMQRLATVEHELESVKDLKSKVAVIEERTRNTDNNVTAMRENLARLTDHLIDEGRNFAKGPRRPD